MESEALKPGMEIYESSGLSEYIFFFNRVTRFSYSDNFFFNFFCRGALSGSMILNGLIINKKALYGFCMAQLQKK